MPKNTPTVADMKSFLPQVPEHDTLGLAIRSALLNMPQDKAFPQNCQDRPHKMVADILKNWPEKMTRPRRDKTCQRLGKFIAETWNNYYAAAHAKEKAA